MSWIFKLQDKLKFYLPESLLYKINNPDAEFLIHIGIVLLVIILIVLLIGNQQCTTITILCFIHPLKINFI